jgi:hypothetical protein
VLQQLLPATSLSDAYPTVVEPLLTQRWLQQPTAEVESSCPRAWHARCHSSLDLLLPVLLLLLLLLPLTSYQTVVAT